MVSVWIAIALRPGMSYRITGRSVASAIGTEVRQNARLRRLGVVGSHHQQAVRARLLGLLGQVHRMDGVERADAGDDLRAVTDRVDGRTDQVGLLAV